MLHLLPVNERPRERCLGKGPETLSLRECLTLLLSPGPPGTGGLGLAEALLQRTGKDLPPRERDRAFFLAMEENASAHLQDLRGLGPAAQARLLAAVELGRRYALHRANERRERTRDPLLGLPISAQALNRIPQERRYDSREWLGFVPLYRDENVGELCLVEKGVRTHVNVDPAELFARVLALRPGGIFLFHNHPSGKLAPSFEDLTLTSRVRKLSQQLGIRFFGHGIVAPEGECWVPQ
ncbi:MAG: hypothetical protein NDJ89_01090 [Oligoflexia bacterium]|nr:hypothetical protein [Oligoflexia bacterium]